MGQAPESLECLLIHDNGVKNEHKIIRIYRNPQNTVNIEEVNGTNQQYAVYEFAEPSKGQSAISLED